MEEIWKDIEGYEGLYQVSSEGRVRSLDRIEYCPKFGMRKRNGRLLQPQIHNNYRRVMLSKNGSNKTYKVSRLIYQTFNGNIPNGMEVNHINEITTDDRVANLNLMSHIDNCNWGTRNERIGRHKRVPVTQILPDGTEFFSYFSATDAANGNSSLRKHITACCRGQRKTAGGFKWRYAS